MSALRKQTKIWVTKSGQRIRVCDMSDAHLLNVIRFLRRRKDRIIAEGWTALGMMAGEYAQMALEGELEWLEECTDINDIHPCGEALLLEAARRGLDPWK